MLKSAEDINLTYRQKTPRIKRDRLADNEPDGLRTADFKTCVLKLLILAGGV